MWIDAYKSILMLPCSRGKCVFRPNLRYPCHFVIRVALLTYKTLELKTLIRLLNGSDFCYRNPITVRFWGQQVGL